MICILCERSEILWCQRSQGQEGRVWASSGGMAAAPIQAHIHTPFIGTGVITEEAATLQSTSFSGWEADELLAWVESQLDAETGRRVANSCA
jgi:hypothetical protein